ncbi:MAG: hypothetical protein J6P79_12315 [Pseudobutyrivibrio sp.]|nr:hypothetical protein [Pseudobutyrivibrio sp.]
MADISVKNNIHIESTTVTKATPSSHSSKPTVSEKQPTSDKSTDVLTKEYGPVVSSSKDGDTVRVKHDNDEESNLHKILQEELERLSEKKFEMPDYEVHTAANEIQKNTWDMAEEASTITSFAGYSDSELKQLYLKGDISQIDYNQEMESRTARKASEAEDLQSFNNTTAKSFAKLSQIENDANTVDIIESGQVSDTIPDEIRIQALQNFDIL